MITELYRKYRPRKLKQLIGQDAVVKVVQSMLDDNRVPHCILASGPSGVGKTTLFRILARELDCSGLDFTELDAADLRGIDVIREMKSTLHLAPMSGKCKVWVLDECHQLTPQAQEGLLKILEDTPEHVYIFLASTDPHKLKNTIHTRCTHLVFKPISVENLIRLCKIVYKLETKSELEDEKAKLIAEASNGSARKALVILNKVMPYVHEENNIQSLIDECNKENSSAISICRALFSPKIDWTELSKILSSLEEDDNIESIRHMILSYAKKVLLTNPKLADRARLVIEEFRDSFYDCKTAGLVVSCYNVVTQI